MPSIEMSGLEKQLRANKPSKVYFIYGNEAYLKRKAVERLLEVCVDADTEDFNYQRFFGSDVDIREVDDASGQLPIMAEHRCILLEDYDIVRASADALERLCDCISNMPDMNVLIIWQNGIESSPKDKKVDRIVKLCSKVGSVMKLDIPRTGELAMLLCEKAEEFGCRLIKNDAYYLIDRCGRDMTTLYGELEKLAIYSGKKGITKEAIDLICPSSVEADVFKISKSILQGKNDDAFKIVERLLAQKVKPVEIFSQLGSNFIDLYRAKCASGAGLSLEQIQEAFPGDYDDKKKFRITDALDEHSHYSLAVLRRYIELLYNAELDLKSGRIDRKTCLEQLVARLCAAKNEGRR